MRRGPAWLLVVGLVAAACRPPGPSLGEPAAATTPVAAPPAVAPVAAAPGVSSPSPTARPTASLPPASPVDLAGLRFSPGGWKTDFSRHVVPLEEIQSGGPPRDGIPPIDRPAFVTPAEAAAWLKDVEPVVLFEAAGDARAYPLQVLIWHEIVNDTVGGRPVAITFCPLCNTAITFDRRLDGIVYDFGTTGNLRHSDLVMWDRQTESWWQQITGEAIVGALAGRRLTMLPAGIVSFRDFRLAHPQGTVLSKETGFSRDYGRNPYVGYDDVNSSPFLFGGRTDGRLRPMERVVTVSLGGEDAAYPFGLLEQRRVANDTVGGTNVVVFYKKGTASALDQRNIAGSRDLGAAAVYEATLDGRPLSFRAEGERFLDEQTGSEWSLLGRATSGPLAGRRLTPVLHGNHFWFAWAVFKPRTRVWAP